MRTILVEIEVGARVVKLTKSRLVFGKQRGHVPSREMKRIFAALSSPTARASGSAYLVSRLDR